MRSSLGNLPDTGCGNIVELTYERMRRYEGSWHFEKTALLPEYVLVEGADGDNMEKYLDASGKEWRSVSRSFEEFFREACDSCGNFSMSRGVIKQGVTRVTEGPLMGKEGLICRIDRHKRLAELRISPLDEGTVKVGLEITEKK